MELSYRNAEKYKYRTIMLIPRTNGYLRRDGKNECT